MILINKTQCEKLTFSDQKTSWGVGWRALGKQEAPISGVIFTVIRETIVLAMDTWLLGTLLLEEANVQSLVFLSGSLPLTLKHIFHFSFTSLTLLSLKGWFINIKESSTSKNTQPLLGWACVQTHTHTHTPSPCHILKEKLWPRTTNLYSLIWSFSSVSRLWGFFFFFNSVVPPA